MTAEPGRAATRDRIVGLDLARFVAIAGMMATHIWLYADMTDGELVWGSSLFEGRASALFAVLAGVGSVFATRGPLRDGNRAAARWMLVGRGAALVFIGLFLTLLDNRILVILTYYGAMFWLLAIVITWRRWAIAVAVVVVAVGAPIVSYLVATAAGLGGDGTPNLGFASFADPVALVRDLFLTGTYPALIWFAYGLTGVLVGRALLAVAGRRRGVGAAETGAAGAGAAGAGAGASAAGAVAAGTAGGGVAPLRLVCVRLIAIGAALWAFGAAASALALGPFGAARTYAAQLGYSEPDALALLLDDGSGHPEGGRPMTLFSAAAHTGTTFDLLVTAGFALVLIGLLVLVGTLFDRSRAGRMSRRIPTPVTGMGAAPLTVYTAHVLLVGIVTTALLPKPFDELSYDEYVALGTPWYISSAGFWLLNVAMGLAIGTLLVLLGRRGPLETMVTWVGRQFATIANWPDLAKGPGIVPPPN